MTDEEWKKEIGDSYWRGYMTAQKATMLFLRKMNKELRDYRVINKKTGEIGRKNGVIENVRLDKSSSVM